MRVDVAVHQVQSSYVESAIGPSDEDPDPDSLNPQNAIGGIYGKVLDGASWMERYDEHPRAIGDFDVVRQRVRDHAEHSRQWVPWANVLGHEATTEGALAGKIADVAQAARVVAKASDMGAVFIANVEPYPRFWTYRGIESARRAGQYVGHFKANGGTDLWLWVDARAWQLTADRGIGLGSWLNEIKVRGLNYRVLPEVYWTDFNRPPIQSVTEAFRLLDAYDVPRDHVFPTFPGDADPADMVDAVEYAHGSGLGRPNIWQRMNFRPDTARAIAAMDDPWDVPEPSLEPEPTDAERVSALLRRALALTERMS